MARCASFARLLLPFKQDVAGSHPVSHSTRRLADPVRAEECNSGVLGKQTLKPHLRASDYSHPCKSVLLCQICKVIVSPASSSATGRPPRYRRPPRRIAVRAPRESTPGRPPLRSSRPSTRLAPRSDRRSPRHSRLPAIAVTRHASGGTTRTVMTSVSWYC